MSGVYLVSVASEVMFHYACYLQDLIYIYNNMIRNDFDPHVSSLGRVGLVSTSLARMLLCCLIQHGILPMIFRLLTGEKRVIKLGLHIS